MNIVYAIGASVVNYYLENTPAALPKRKVMPRALAIQNGIRQAADKEPEFLPTARGDSLELQHTG
jgi:hypothetical protein